MTNEVVSHEGGTLMMRKPRGKKLTFLIGGPDLAFAQRCTNACKDMVYVWVGFDTGNRVEWSTISNSNTLGECK